ncbi:MarR family transcriptional regulator [Nodosilinea sp. LEGE 06152]|uniref:helix-turn-helix domain-containing protein n=1 Tax=Nodosilinea sp. LEGE 06152 TaxID=2777966 RepID=UPI00187E3EF7|nr:helix-turn-helix domain-containing protein [Nodosilinea sp. LEGE 06152]MBE9158463.1 MarR family transcriptional regulator [Nodosilinea sp. LEGE 06152]
MTYPAHGETPAPRQQQPHGTGPRTMTDLLGLPDPERTLVNWLVRQRGASLADILAHTQTEPAAVQATLDNLLTAGFLTVDEASDPALFKPNLVSRKPRTLPDQLWNALD